MSEMLFTSESVTEGHPDKVCDRISDSVLDALLAQDPRSRVACETLVKTGLVLLAGEVTSTAYVDVAGVARAAIRDIGYTHSDYGFDSETCAVLTAIEEQSADIARGVNGQGVYTQEDQGAGDQGMMFGYACDQTDEMMPLPITLAHRLTHRLAITRKDKTLPWLRPDGKSQVSVRYVDNKPQSIDAVVLATQHDEDIAYEQLRQAIMEEVIKPVVPSNLINGETKFFINPTGRFVIGGPKGDSGLTGRKIIVDTYGGWGRHGGGAFSGKDPSKVDRSAAYYARYIAKNIIAAGLAQSAEVQLAYAIGVAEPVSILVDTAGTGKFSDEKLAGAVREVFDCRPRAIVDQLNLLRPIYAETAAYGHFGRSGEGFTWEVTDRAEALRAALS